MFVRRRFALLFAFMAALMACAATVAFWQWKAPALLARRLGLAIGRQVRVGAVGLTWRFQVVARDVDVAGAPPFESQSLMRIDRLVVSLRGPGGWASPSAVTIDGADIEYLATAEGDNLRGLSSSRRAGLAALPRGPKPASPRISLRNGRLRGSVLLPHAPPLAVRAQQMETFRDDKGQIELALHDLVVDADGVASLRAARLAVEAGPSPLMSASGVALDIPGGGTLVDNLAFEGKWSGSASSFELHSKETLEPQVTVAASWDAQSAELTTKLHGLPLRALGTVANGRALGLDNAKAQLQAHVTVNRSTAHADFQIDGKVTALDILHPAVDSTPWRNQSGWFYARGQAGVTGPLAIPRIDLEEASFKALGTTVRVSGFVENLRAPRGSLTLSTPPREPLSCPALLFAQPQPIREALAGMDLQGSLGFKVTLAFDASALQDLKLDVDLGPVCQVTHEARVLADLLPALRNPKTAAPPPTFKAPLGPSHPDFVAVAHMPPHLPAAFITSEDSKFFHHQGFDTDMIRHALAQDLGNHSFDRGASTITQQLAKNLFLTHRRTLARKLEEAVLTWRLQKLLSKERVLEVYLNVIELGPGIRGVTQAARKYFGKDVADLLPIESAHLAALTPNPHVLARRFRDGEVDEGWQQRLYDLLGMMKRHHRLSAEELAAARSSKLELRDWSRDEALARPN